MVLYLPSSREHHYPHTLKVKLVLVVVVLMIIYLKTLLECRFDMWRGSL